MVVPTASNERNTVHHDDAFSGPAHLAPIGVWAGSLRALPIESARDLARELDDLGYGVLWFPESDARDPFVHLALLLDATERIAGGTAIASIWARDALAMACAGRTLAEAFPGRVLLGLGVSHQPLVEGMRGHEYASPLATMRAYLDAMDAATYTAVEPVVPAPRLLSALGPKMLELAAERTQGTIPYLAPVEHTAISRAALPDSALVCPVQAFVLDDDRDRARDIARRCHVANYLALPNYTNNLRRLGFGDDDLRDGGSDGLVDALVACGPAAVVRDRVAQQFAAGADHVCLQVIAADPAPPLAAWRAAIEAVAGLTRRPRTENRI